MLDSLPLPTQGQYTYKPLETADSIRLLTLHLGTRDDPIDCTLSHKLTKDCQYRALSYEWGDEGDVGGIITVNGLSFPRRMQKNLESALREIRSEKEDVVLWIDAICINQGDATEKGHQVAMMRKIFREAESVIAWLGPEADNSEMAMDLIADKKTLHKKAESRELNNAELEALVPIAYRSYWSRVWIIQEFFLARNPEIRCGTKAVSYDEFRSYLEATSLPNSQFRDPPWKRGTDSPPTHTHMFARMVQQPTDPDSILFNTHLFSWLRRSHDLKSQASNPRDYIYALLGVSDDCSHGELVPDYDDREETVRETLLSAIPICLKSMHPRHRKYSDRRSRAGFFVKYAQKMGIAIDSELQSDIAKLMYIKSEDLDLEEEIGSDFCAVMYTRNLSTTEHTEMMAVMKLVKLAESRGQPFFAMILQISCLKSLFPALQGSDILPKELRNDKICWRALARTVSFYLSLQPNALPKPERD